MLNRSRLGGIFTKIMCLETEGTLWTNSTTINHYKKLRFERKVLITRFTEAYLQLTNKHVKMLIQCLHFRLHTVESLSRSPHGTFFTNLENKYNPVAVTIATQPAISREAIHCIHTMQGMQSPLEFFHPRMRNGGVKALVSGKSETG